LGRRAGEFGRCGEAGLAGPGIRPVRGGGGGRRPGDRGQPGHAVRPATRSGPAGL